MKASLASEREELRDRSTAIFVSRPMMHCWSAPWGKVIMYSVFQKYSLFLSNVELLVSCKRVDDGSQF